MPFRFTPGQLAFMGVYLDPLTADTGALRIIPGSHRYTTRDVFGVPDGPLLTTASPERLRHLAQLLEHVPGE